MAVVIETTIGDFTVDLYTDERPQTCRNFLKLCKVKYYNWNLFHTVQSNFIAQAGDPTGTGRGGESVYGLVLGDEARYYEGEQMPKIKHDKSGLLSMVNCGNNMLGSQFFITLAPHLQSLDGEHCVFGEIAEGLDIVLKFNETICDGEHRPYQDIRISHTVILEDPFEDPRGLAIPDQSPKPTKEALMSDRIGADEIIDDTAGMTAEEIIEMQKEKEAKARATILEIVGDIPDADMAPPENVLFVCKLNPVTTDDDLEIIFSRFGQIRGCEVIRDRQTGDSLQYAFIEFAERKSCEEAYFKMDNVLIDDRRIHVDFSQSVAKMRWRGKGKGIKYFDEKGKELSINDIHGVADLRRGRIEGRGEHRKFERRKEAKKKIEIDHSRDGRRCSLDGDSQKEVKRRNRYKESYHSNARRDKERALRYERYPDQGSHQDRNRNYRQESSAAADTSFHRRKTGCQEDSYARRTDRTREKASSRYHVSREKKKHDKKENRVESSPSSSANESTGSFPRSASTSSPSSRESEYEHRKKKRTKSREERHRKSSLKHEKKKRKNA